MSLSSSLAGPLPWSYSMDVCSLIIPVESGVLNMSYPAPPSSWSSAPPLWTIIQRKTITNLNYPSFSCDYVHFKIHCRTFLFMYSGIIYWLCTTELGGRITCYWELSEHLGPWVHVLYLKCVSIIMMEYLECMWSGYKESIICPVTGCVMLPGTSRVDGGAASLPTSAWERSTLTTLRSPASVIQRTARRQLSNHYWPPLPFLHNWLWPWAQQNWTLSAFSLKHWNFKVEVSILLTLWSHYNNDVGGAYLHIQIKLVWYRLVIKRCLCC